ncbi:MAG: type I-D CRISPR-associated endonuclease Cas1d [Rivularia sp. (in: cyanobacteria)]
MSVLYVTQPDAVLSKTHEAFKVALKQSDGSWSKHTVPAQTVEEVVLMGNPQVTGDALVYALELGMPVHYLSYFGKHLASTLPAYSRNGQLRLAQYAAYCDQKRKLEIAKTIVTAKIHNQHTVLYRYGQKDNPLKDRKQLVQQQNTIDEVRGVEGLAAREYFACWSEILPEGWTFDGRNRQPPTDEINSLLGFAYGLLRVQVTAAAHVAGLDPYIGYLHETTRGQPAIVLDLMEEFRPLIADTLIFAVIRHKEIKPGDFTESLGAYRLCDRARKNFLEAWERKMNDEFKHPNFGYRCNYRRAIELQARLFSRHLQEGIPYKALTRR